MTEKIASYRRVGYFFAPTVGRVQLPMLADEMECAKMVDAINRAYGNDRMMAKRAAR